MSAALSVSPFAAALLAGPRRVGKAIGHGYVRIGDDVLAVTRPGAARMPNGIETELELEPGERVTVGRGELRTETGVVTLGPRWNPRPRVRLAARPRARPRLERLAGRGPGLTPLGDDVLVGYLAGSALAGAAPSAIAALAERAGRQTTALSRTLLLLAAKGQLPEPAHRFLEQGDPEPLLQFGVTSGRGIALGLRLAAEVPALEAQPCS